MRKVVAGGRLPETRITFTELDLFLYSAACGLPHRIHYDKAYAVLEGHSGIVVHGPLQAAHLLRVLGRWAREHGLGRTVSMRYRLLSSAYSGQELTFGGEVAEQSGEDLSVRLWVCRVSDKTATCSGEAKIRTVI